LCDLHTGLGNFTNKPLPLELQLTLKVEICH
jgi:hypothetical protein